MEIREQLISFWNHLRFSKNLFFTFLFLGVFADSSNKYISCYFIYLLTWGDGYVNFFFISFFRKQIHDMLLYIMYFLLHVSFFLFFCFVCLFLLLPAVVLLLTIDVEAIIFGRLFVSNRDNNDEISYNKLNQSSFLWCWSEERLKMFCPSRDCHVYCISRTFWHCVFSPSSIFRC